MGVYRDKKSGIYQIEFQLGGIQVRRSAGRGATRQQAEQLEIQLRKEVLDQIHRARIGAPGKHTFGDVFVEWLSNPALMKRDHGLKSHIRQVRPFAEHRLLSDAVQVKNEMVKEFAKRGLKQGTINRRIAVLTRAISIARDVLAWNVEPVTGKISQAPANNERFVIKLTEKDLKAICKHMTDPEAVRATYLAAWTGLRKRELLGLKPENYQDHKIVLWSGTTKNGKWRVIPLHKRARKYAKRLPLGVTYDKLRYEWEAARKAAGMPHVQFRDLRHVFATLIAESGANAYEIQQLLGHSDIRVSQRYVNLVAAHLKTAIDRVK